MAATYPPGIPVLVPGERLNPPLVEGLFTQAPPAGSRVRHAACDGESP